MPVMCIPPSDDNGYLCFNKVTEHMPPLLLNWKATF